MLCTFGNVFHLAHVNTETPFHIRSVMTKTASSVTFPIIPIIQRPAKNHICYTRRFSQDHMNEFVKLRFIVRIADSQYLYRVLTKYYSGQTSPAYFSDPSNQKSLYKL